MLHYYYKYANASTYGYSMSIIGDNMVAKIELPGVDKEDISLSFSEDDGGVTVSIKDKQGYFIPIHTSINHKGITADLELGILTVTIPKKNTSHSIQIK